VIVTLALAGGVARTVYLHPISDGKVTMVGAGPHAEGAHSLRGVMGRGVRAKLLPLYRGTPPRVHPRGLPEPIGWEEVPELLLGGRRRRLAQAGMTASAAAKHAPQGGVASGSGAYVARAAWAPGGVALATCATDPGQALAAALAKAQQMRRRVYLVVMDPDRNEASWCGWHLALHNNASWVHWHGSWWRLRSSDLAFHQYFEGSLVKALHHKHGRPFRAQAASTIPLAWVYLGIAVQQDIYKHMLSKGCAGGNWHASIECTMTFRMHSLKALMFVHRPSYAQKLRWRLV
jgi:hypothetical protein